MAYGFRRPCPLRLEVLGERALPSITVTDDGTGVVTITGDQKSNDIQITDNGSAGVTVVADGEEHTLDGTVTEIKVLSRGGADDVSYSVGDEVTDAVTRTLTVELGNQHDSFEGDVGSLPAGSDLELYVNGGNGHDTLTVNGGAVAGGLTVELRGGNGKDSLSAGFAGDVSGELFVTLLGGNGKDLVTSAVNGVVTGTLDQTLDGGNGSDTVEARVDAGAGSTGTVSTRVLGWNGRDDLGLAVTGVEGALPAGWVLEIDGGRGRDNVSPLTSEFVNVVNAEV